MAISFENTTRAGRLWDKLIDYVQRRIYEEDLFSIPRGERAGKVHMASPERIRETLWTNASLIDDFEDEYYNEITDFDRIFLYSWRKTAVDYTARKNGTYVEPNLTDAIKAKKAETAKKSKKQKNQKA